MNWDARRSWLLAYMAERTFGVDTLNADFVWAYWQEVKCKGQPVGVGAPRVPQLGRDLKRLHDEGALDRSRAPIKGMGLGWPKWVWHYDLTPQMRPVAKLIAEQLKALK